MYGPYRHWYYGTSGGGSGPSVGSGPSLPSGGSPGGTLSDMSRGMGSGLSNMSVGFGAMLTAASSTMTSRPAELVIGWRLAAGRI